MRAPAAVCVNDDFAAGEASIALGPANDELPRGVDVQVREVAKERECRLAVFQQDFGECFLDHLLHDEFVHVLHAWGRLIGASVPSDLLASRGLGRLRMLRGDDNGVELEGFDGAIGLLQVLNGDLRLAIGPEPPELAALAHVRELLTELGRHRVSEWHAILRLVGRVAEHDALVASAYVEVLLAHVDAAGNVGALLVDTH
mmetsp:Transcript_70359/g.159743  ORF Transcript_70359/g.159743 Transcript_70359/m.159743 type:complete len:201 (-) Transcript_70359:405-1007(-)